MNVDDFKDFYKKRSRNEAYPRRIEALKKLNRETEHLERGISETEQTLKENYKSFVVYGEPQSGKTEFMIALACKLLDLNYRTIFVVMNDNTELEIQNFERFHQAAELNPSPIRDKDVAFFSEVELKNDKQRVIFCRKNSANLQKLVNYCRFMQRRVVIDDEADFATPNARINKNQITAINKYLGELGQLSEVYGADRGTYIGVTATPARLDLNNTYLNVSKKWIYLDSHSHYKGRSFFFPVSDEEKHKSDFQLVKLPDQGDNPSYMRSAILRFLCRVAILNLANSSGFVAYSMLIHTAGKTDDHLEDQKQVYKVMDTLGDETNNKYTQYLTELLKTANEVVELHQISVNSQEIAAFILDNIGKRDVLVINHKNDGANVKRAGQPNALFTFAIGGNIVSRGLTFDNLLTFFFSRDVRNKLTQNTYIQRARMFGTRKYSQYFELCVPEKLYYDWATCFQDHEISLRLGRAGVYQHIQSGRTKVTDGASLDKQHVVTGESERAIGKIFHLTPEIEKILISKGSLNAMGAIYELINLGLLTHDHFLVL